eukprot:5564227-Pleurochrysis_carterae.AAC.1
MSDPAHGKFADVILAQHAKNKIGFGASDCNYLKSAPEGYKNGLARGDVVAPTISLPNDALNR